MLLTEFRNFQQIVTEEDGKFMMERIEILLVPRLEFVFCFFSLILNGVFIFYSISSKLLNRNTNPKRSVNGQ